MLLRAHDYEFDETGRLIRRPATEAPEYRWDDWTQSWYVTRPTANPRQSRARRSAWRRHRRQQRQEDTT